LDKEAYQSEAGESAKTTGPKGSDKQDQLLADCSDWQARQGEDPGTGPPADMWDRMKRDIDLSLEDYQNYYTGKNLGLLALGIGLAAPVANTSADQSIRHWYQRHVRGETSDEFAQVAGYGGEFWLILPVCVEAAALAGKVDEDYTNNSFLYEWSNRSLRSIMVGAPPMLALYVILGSSRPDRENSNWHPFQDIHGVSGHTFMGAVPFLTAAEMVDDPLLKYSLVAGSFLTGWARLNNDRHYMSQIGLGWWMAYLAVRRVDETEAAHKAYTLLPTCGEGPGVGVLFRF